MAYSTTAQHLTRFQVTVSVIAKLWPVRNITDAMRAAYLALGLTLNNAEKAVGTALGNYNSKANENTLAWLALWRELVAWYGIASVLAPDGDPRTALDMIDTSTEYTIPNAQQRAKETRNALVQFPADFEVNDKTATELIAAIDAMFAAESEEADLLTAHKSAVIALRETDKALDKENKAIYKILCNSYSKGSQEYQLVMTIPTLKRKKKAGTGTGTGSTSTTTPGLPEHIN